MSYLIKPKTYFNDTYNTQNNFELLINQLHKRSPKIQQNSPKKLFNNSPARSYSNISQDQISIAKNSNTYNKNFQEYDKS